MLSKKLHTLQVCWPHFQIVTLLHYSFVFNAAFTKTLHVTSSLHWAQCISMQCLYICVENAKTLF